jgi:hypothetical protein
MLMATVLFYIRSRNASSVDLEFAFDEFKDIAETPKRSKIIEFEDEEILSEDEIMRRRQIKRKIGRKKSPSITENNQEPDFSVGVRMAVTEPLVEEDEPAPVVVRRRSGNVKRNRDGTAIKGKRKQLGAVGSETKPIIAKKVSTKKKTIKTRRVVTGQTEQQVMDSALDRLTNTDDYQQN